MTSQGTATRWLGPLRAAVSELTDLDLARLGRFESPVRLLAGYPVDAGLDPGVRSQHLQQIRCGLADSGHLALAVPARYGGCGRPAVLQTLLQFICGYHDVDLRDASGLGHGRLIAEHAAPGPATSGCRPCSPELCPVSRSLNRTAAARSTPPGPPPPRPRPDLDGDRHKDLDQPPDRGRAVLRVLHRPRRAALAAAIDAASPGLTRQPIVPAGLSGWAWGELRLQAVTVRPGDILGEPGEGMALLREHFANYRPLVAATALGAAAHVHDQTAGWLDGRRQAGVIAGPARQRPDHPWPYLRPDQRRAARRAYCPAPRRKRVTARATVGCAVKAHGADVAYQAASELALLTGAAGFTARSRHHQGPPGPQRPAVRRRHPRQPLPLCRPQPHPQGHLLQHPRYQLSLPVRTPGADA